MFTILCTYLIMMLSVPGNIVPDRLLHDFGSVEKTVDVLECDFTLTNNNTEAVSISDVTVGCHCTTVDWSSDPIKPGCSARIHVTYHKEFYYDSFDKAVTVYFSNGEDPVQFRITGSFYDSPASLIKDFPRCEAGLGIQDVTVPPPIKLGERYTGLVQMANCTESPLQLVFEDVTPGLRLSVPEEEVSALSRIMVGYVIDSDSTRLGFQNYTAIPVVNGVRQATVSFSVLCHEDFSAMSIEQQDKGSLPMLTATSCSFGTVGQGNQASASIVFMNRGRSKLVLTSLAAASDAVSATLPDEVISGGAAVIKLSIDTTKLTPGTYSIPVYATTNSPLKPYFSFVLTGTVN